jgi:superfamily I DNA/RNA helicase
VAFDLSSTKACVNSKFPDDEHRLAYVATSRAKHNLFLVHTDKEFRYVV